MKFYFTYGSEGHPFKGGWTEVIAEDEDQAIEAFRIVHPNHTGCMKCADIYGESFAETRLYKNGNFGAKCHEVINADEILGRK